MTKKCEHLETITDSDIYYHYYHWPDGTEAGYMCEKCAKSNCFCLSCGGFFGGTDYDEHMVYSTGFCSDCYSEFADDEYDPDLDFGLDPYGNDTYDPEYLASLGDEE